MAKPDRRRMEHAVREFLAGAGLSLADANLKSTPRRVVDAWASEFLDGYGKTAAEVLAERFPVGRKGERELVVVTQLHFRSMCPHHLLPYTGRAHVAYLPGKSVVGFGRLAALVDVFAHRLILQEELAQSVAKALAKHLSSPAAACVIEAEQSCLRLRGGHQRDAVTHAEAYEGLLRKDGALRRELWQRIPLPAGEGAPTGRVRGRTRATP